MESVAEAASRIAAGGATAVIAGGMEIDVELSRCMMGPRLTECVRGVDARAGPPVAKLAPFARLRAARCWRRASRSWRGSPTRCAASTWARPPRCWRASSGSRARSRTRSRSTRTSAPSPRSTSGRLAARRCPSIPAPAYEPVADDVGPRREQTLEPLAKLKPYFDRRNGTVTVGNACPITDGAAAMLVHVRGGRGAPRATRRWAASARSRSPASSPSAWAWGRCTRRRRRWMPPGSRSPTWNWSRSTRRSPRRCWPTCRRSSRRRSRSEKLGRAGGAVGAIDPDEAQRQRRRDRARPPGRRRADAHRADAAARSCERRGGGLRPGDAVRRRRAGRGGRRGALAK